VSGEMIKQLSWAVFLAIFFAPGFVRAQTFNFTAIEFQARLNKVLTDDHGDTIKACKKDGADYRCTFNDAEFQKSVAAFKELNLANGRFALNEVMYFTIEGGKVSRITIGGDRSDPMNLMHTEWQAAAEVLTLIGEHGGDPMIAHIAMM
jgi:hypothetical protein